MNAALAQTLAQTLALAQTLNPNSAPTPNQAARDKAMRDRERAARGSIPTARGSMACLPVAGLLRIL